VLFSSTLVDVAANMELLRETADACNFILQKHPLADSIAVQEQSPLSAYNADSLISDKYRESVDLGFSTGTLDDKIAGAIETGTSTRLEADQGTALASRPHFQDLRHDLPFFAAGRLRQILGGKCAMPSA